MRYLSVLCILLTATALASCQAAQPLPGKEPSSKAVPEDLTERYVHQIVQSLRDSFVAKDSQGFMKHVSEGFYKGRTRLQKSLELEFQKGRAMSLETEVVRVSKGDPSVTATVRWTRSGDAEADEVTRGETLLVFHMSETLSLVNFRDGSLFGISGF